MRKKLLALCTVEFNCFKLILEDLSMLILLHLRVLYLGYSLGLNLQKKFLE